MPADLTDYAELKLFALKRKNGSAKRAAAWTLISGLLWSLEEGVSADMVDDMVALARFEHSRKLAEGK